MRVYTTLDPDLQKDADEGLPQIAELGNRLGAALVSIDPQTGYIKAMVGGRTTHKKKSITLPSSNRQMGSSFKMYTLVAALSGMNPRLFLTATPYANYQPGSETLVTTATVQYTASRYGLLFSCFTQDLLASYCLSTRSFRRAMPGYSHSATAIPVYHSGSQGANPLLSSAPSHLYCCRRCSS